MKILTDLLTSRRKRTLARYGLLIDPTDNPIIHYMRGGKRIDVSDLKQADWEVFASLPISPQQILDAFIYIVSEGKYFWPLGFRFGLTIICGETDASVKWYRGARLQGSGASSATTLIYLAYLMCVPVLLYRFFDPLDLGGILIVPMFLVALLLPFQIPPSATRVATIREELIREVTAALEAAGERS